MSNVYYTNVLDDPYYIGNGTFLSVVTNGKVRVEGETDRDYNKDAGAKAGLLPAWGLLTLPDAVNLNLFFAELFVFSLLMLAVLYTWLVNWQ